MYRVGIKVTDFTMLGAPLLMQSSPPLLQKKTQQLLVCKSAHNSSFKANEHNLLLFLYVSKEKVTFKEGFGGNGANGRKIFTQEKKLLLGAN